VPLTSRLAVARPDTLQGPPADDKACQSVGLGLGQLANATAIWPFVDGLDGLVRARGGSCDRGTGPIAGRAFLVVVLLDFQFCPT
jgi:hypothetical protein